MTASSNAVRIVGGVVPGELPDRVLANTVTGISPADYHLPAGETLRTAASRSWAYLTGVYARYRADLDRLPDGAPDTQLTREGWLAPLLKELGYGRVPVTPGGHLEAGHGDERSDYPISHLWQDIPMHLLGWNIDLDSRTKGVAGAARAPQSMVQEYLNRAPEHLWAIVSNGRTLRLLRDSTALVGQAYIEFDLETIFDGDLFADFMLLYAICHESRLALLPAEDDEPAPVGNRWIERWRTDAIADGTRALTSLRGQVEQAIETLGTGYLAHPANQTLRERLASGGITPADYQRALLRIIYRLLFWMVAEDRGVLLTPDATRGTAARYDTYFSSRRLRNLARRRLGTAHHDLAAQVDLVFTGLGQPGGLPQLGLPGLGGIYEPSEIDTMTGAALSNRALLDVIRLLSTTRDPASGLQRAVDFRHLGSEELGGIYEGLLELHPLIDPGERTYTLTAGAGNERKTTGSYYTPTSLIDLVLDTALDPLLDRANAAGTPEHQEAALLALRVCDPACGSGHFLVAAARRIANRVARLRSGESEPTEAQAHAALHDVVNQCIYGVDLNPMAIELAKVSLWLEAIQPGRPLGFLDAHLRVGNSLLGATPALIAAGVPEAAYTPITADDKTTAIAWKKTNKGERDRLAAGQEELFSIHDTFTTNMAAAVSMRELARTTAMTLEDIALQRQRYDSLRATPELSAAKTAADAWTAAFFQTKTADGMPITSDTVHRAQEGKQIGETTAVEVEALAAAHRFFHWHVEFPDIFTTGGHTDDQQFGWTGGFDAIIGNPPWETVQMTEKEFFAERDPDIANAPNAAKRKRLIAALPETNPALWHEFRRASRANEAINSFVRGSGRYPLTARGKTNTYALFAETFRDLINPTGRAGIITPTGIATDATTAPFIADTLRTRRLAAFYDFENAQPLFVGVHRSFRFAAATYTGRNGTDAQVPLAFMLHNPADIAGKAFALTPDEILMLNPNTGTLPVFATRTDADITLGIYRRHPILIRDGDPDGNPWGLSFKQGLFNMASDSHLFHTADDLKTLGATFDGWAWTAPNPDGTEQRWLPLYEAKMLSHWNHRFSTYENATQAQLNVGSLPRLTVEQLDNPAQETRPRYWIAETDIDTAIGDRTDRGWLFGFRRLGRSSDMRTLIPFVLPRSALGDNGWLLFTGSAIGLEGLEAALSSLVADYLMRQKLSGTTLSSYYLAQLATPTLRKFQSSSLWSDQPLFSWTAKRSLELIYTSYRIAPFARDMGDTGEPFRWIPERRMLIQAELDAAMMHLFGLTRDEVDHVLDSFPVLRKYEERDHGEFRTKRLVLDFYDKMAAAAESGDEYQTPIDPPPGSGPRHPRPVHKGE